MRTLTLDVEPQLRRGGVAEPVVRLADVVARVVSEEREENN